jgi:hypothetical protein
MEKPQSGTRLVCVLNLVLVMITVPAMYFGFARSSVGRGEDVRQAVMQIGDNIRYAVTNTAPPSRRMEAVLVTTGAGEDTRDMDALYTTFLLDITAKKQRETIEEDRLIGLLSRLETSVRESRYEEAREIAWEMETAAQQKGDDRYLYLARSVSRLVKNAGTQPRYGASLAALEEELGRLKAERDLYRRNLQEVEAEQRFAESALSLQDSNAQIQEMLLETLREQYAQSQEALLVTRAQLDAGETFTTLEAKERTREGYEEGLGEARDLLERSLRIRSRDSRIAFLNEARTRYPSDSAMARLIETLLERL